MEIPDQIHKHAIESHVIRLSEDRVVDGVDSVDLACLGYGIEDHFYYSCCCLVSALVSNVFGDYDGPYRYSTGLLLGIEKLLPNQSEAERASESKSDNLWD